MHKKERRGQPRLGPLAFPLMQKRRTEQSRTNRNAAGGPPRDYRTSNLDFLPARKKTSDGAPDRRLGERSLRDE
jgi:hypothetical protein